MFCQLTSRLIKIFETHQNTHLILAYHFSGYSSKWPLSYGIIFTGMLEVFNDGMSTSGSCWHFDVYTAFIYLTPVWTTTIFDFVPKWVKLVPNETKLWLFRSDFSTFWPGELKFTEIGSEKVPDLANLRPIWLTLDQNVTSMWTIGRSSPSYIDIDIIKMSVPTSKSMTSSHETTADWSALDTSVTSSQETTADWSALDTSVWLPSWDAPTYYK